MGLRRINHSCAVDRGRGSKCYHGFLIFNDRATWTAGKVFTWKCFRVLGHSKFKVMSLNKHALLSVKNNLRSVRKISVEENTGRNSILKRHHHHHRPRYTSHRWAHEIYYDGNGKGKEFHERGKRFNGECIKFLIRWNRHFEWRSVFSSRTY